MFTFPPFLGSSRISQIGILLLAIGLLSSAACSVQPQSNLANGGGSIGGGSGSGSGSGGSGGGTGNSGGGGTTGSGNPDTAGTAWTLGGFDGPAELPRYSVLTALADTPAPGKTISVNAGGDLQGALDSANCGDTISIATSGVFTGTFTLPEKSCDDAHWVIVRTAAPDSSLPPEGSRLTPCYAAVLSLPGRPAFSCPQATRVIPKIMAGGNYAFTAAAGANHYRLLGLEVTHASGMPVGQPDTLVSLTGSPVPSKVIVDRCWIHGTATNYLKRGVRINGSNLAVIDSTITDVHAVDTPTQGIYSGTAPGPLKISDNFVEGGDSAIGFGGQANSYGNPSDVEISRNHLFKPLSWQYGDPTYLGYPFSAKVALESKNSVRVLLDGNIMENTWGGLAGGPAQGGDGSISWLGPKNQFDVCPTCQVTDITVRNNIIRHAGAGFYIFDGASDAGGIAVQGARFSIHDNIFDNINATYAGNGSGNGIIHRFSGSDVFAPPKSVSVIHNTGFTAGPNTAALSLDTTSDAPYVDFTYSDNLEISGTYGILGCHSLLGMSVLTNCAPGYTFIDNALIGANGTFATTKNNYFPANGDDVGFVNYQNGNGGDYRLCQGPGDPASSCTAASPYIQKGSDGLDLGANVDAVNAETAGVE